MEYTERLERLRQQMQMTSIDVVFLPISADLQYLTGIPRKSPNFGAMMYPGDWLTGAFIGRDFGPLFLLPRMIAEYQFANVKLDNLRVLGDRDDPFALVLDVLNPFNLPDSPRIAIGSHAETVIALHKLLPGAIFSNANELIRPLRRLKSAEEIELIRRAGATSEAAFKDVLGKLRHGITEIEIIAEVDLQLRLHGASHSALSTTVHITGPQVKLSIGQANQLPLVPPVALLFDFGAVYEGYCYNFGRTVFFGEPDAEMQKIHETVMASQKAGIAALQAGSATCQDVDRAARTIITQAKYGPYFRHRLGHGIGLDLHEPPFLTKGDATLLEENMVFALEPSIVMPDGGFGARVEDVIVAHPAGGESLTSGFQTLQVI